MSLLSDLLAPFTKVKDAVEALVPETLLQSYGSYAHTIVANLLHDGEMAVKAGVTAAIPMTQTVVSGIINAIEVEVQAAAPDVLAGKVSFQDAIGVAVGNLKSEAVSTFIPALKAVGKTTIQTIASTALSTAVATLAANPMPTQASS